MLKKALVCLRRMHYFEGSKVIIWRVDLCGQTRCVSQSVHRKYSINSIFKQIKLDSDSAQNKRLGRLDIICSLIKSPINESTMTYLIIK